MKELSFTHVNNQQYEMELFLKSRKNLMIYDGIRDGLDKNIGTKVFYSNPYDPFEFINIDFFRQWEYVVIGAQKKRIFGSIYIIRDKAPLSEGIYSEDYGVVEVQNVLIRDIPKSKITFFIGDKGIADIQSLVKHFELNYCKKSCS